MHQAIGHILIGLAVALFGLGYATNFKGLATKHVALSSRFIAPVSPLRKDITPEKLARRERDAVRTGRMGAALMFLLGAYITGNALWHLLLG